MPSTITQILRRHDRIDPKQSRQRIAPKRFERARPNDLWQMDFKGDVALTNRRVSHPLTVLDDHSRFNLCVQSCMRQIRENVQEHLTHSFCRYGLPYAMLMDNSSPWGGRHSNPTRLTLWLLLLGIRVIHGRPYHLQTKGRKNDSTETSKRKSSPAVCSPTALLSPASLRSLALVYNHQRPQEALEMNTPASRYRVSPRTFPEALPPIVYDAGEITRRVSRHGATIHFANRTIRVSKALGGKYVALRPTRCDGVYWVCYGSFAIGEVSIQEIPEAAYGRARIFSEMSRASRGESPCEELVIEAD